MLAKDLITDEIPPLQPTDTGLMAMNWMDEFKVSHLPIVHKHDYLGLISDSDIMDFNITDDSLGSSKITLIRPFVKEEQHIYEVIKLISNLKISVLPVLNEEEKYVGAISAEVLIGYFSKLTASSEPGGIILLEMNVNDYSISQISQIVEGNDCKILSLYVSPVADSTKIEVTIKTNTHNLAPVLQTFYRYNYNVKASFFQSEFIDDMKNRYDSFMNYINM